jgi:hypothetical protein
MVLWRGSFSISKIDLDVLMITFHAKAMNVIENISAVG